MGDRCHGCFCQDDEAAVSRQGLRVLRDGFAERGGRRSLAPQRACEPRCQAVAWGRCRCGRAACLTRTVPTLALQTLQHISVLSGRDVCDQQSALREKVRLLPVSSPANLNFIAFFLPVTGVIDCIFIARGYRHLRCKHCSCAHFSAVLRFLRPQLSRVETAPPAGIPVDRSSRVRLTDHPEKFGPLLPCFDTVFRKSKCAERRRHTKKFACFLLLLLLT